jgi:phosphatidylglycerol:prolipoprotein diacylglycerol transferase
LKKRYKTSFLRVQSFAPSAILVAHGFGRLGCLFAGCCHGAETDAWYGIYMHTNAFGYTKVVPTQLFEALFLFALFAVCFYLVMKKDFKYNFTVYLICYGIWRFIIEFFRADNRGSFVEGVSPSQFWSIVMVVAGVACFFVLRFLYKREAEKNAKLESEQPQEMQEVQEEGEIAE